VDDVSITGNNYWEEWQREKSLLVVLQERSPSIVRPQMPLDKLWSVTIPGDERHVFSSDETSQSLFVGDVWGCGSPTSRDHRR
jgi:hypothetical protein